MMIMNSTSKQVCPICSCTLTLGEREYSLDELLALWKPVTFSKETIDDHGKQSGSTQLYICPSCQFEIFLPQIIGTPNFYVELHNATSGSYYVDDKWDFHEALLDARLADSIIEIGCGPGVFLEKAQLIARQVVGIEYNQRALSIATDKGLTVYGADNADLGSMKGQFDIAVSFHVLEHVSDPVAFVQEMLMWVKPGGKVGISVPNMDGPIKYIDPCVSNMPPHHATRWTLNTFRALSEKLGLKVERFSFEPLAECDHYYYSNYAVKHWLSKIRPKRLRLIAQSLSDRYFESIFRMLVAVDKRTFRGLKGQSIYVVLSKPEKRQ
jgi:SAM-dependent methyltransferase